MAATCFGLILLSRARSEREFIFVITKMVKFVYYKYNRGQNERSVQDGHLVGRWMPSVKTK